MTVVATAGHVDHGKSTLVRALTGVDPDRWLEEKRRGMTIDLGFAATTLPSGCEISFVDVPGHGRFVKNMLAGVGSVDTCLFVVAATEGWKAQSEEHLRILDLLGASRGVIALTKVALAGADLAELAAAEVKERVAGTFLASAAVVAVDVPAGLGLAELRAALEDMVSGIPAAGDRGRPRLWVDRSFTIRGSGTVVTGTLTGGMLEVGDEVVVEAGGHSARIRALEGHNLKLLEAEPGRRVAANLVGISHRLVGRGQAMLRSGQWHLSTCFDTTLEVLGSIGHPVARRGAYAAYIGSGEFPVRLRVLGGERIEPGSQGYARLWLLNGAKIPISPGDRYVLRESGRFQTIGGGEVLDVDPVVPASRASPSRSVERVIADRGWVDVDHLFRLTGEHRTPSIDRWVVDPAALEVTRTRLLERCESAGREGIDLAKLDPYEKAVISEGLDGVAVEAGRALASRFAGGELSDRAREVLKVLAAGGWSPPVFPAAQTRWLRELQRAGLAVQADAVWFSDEAVRSAMLVVSGLVTRQPAGFTVAEARDALGVSRKYTLPLLTHFDSLGITSRRGDLRVAGRRMVLEPGGARG